MKRPLQILQILSDGDFHSGEAIGATLGVTRAAVWKVIKQLIALGIEIHAIPKRGYYIPNGFELLDAEKIRAALDEKTRKLLGDLDILTITDSTTNYIRTKTKSASVCLAEQQTAGRGRRGRQWFSPFGRNIYMSLLWRFAAGPAALAGLSLVVSIAVAESLIAFGIQGIGIKWPNDIVHSQQKLAGILLDIYGDAAGPCEVIISVGLNVAMSAVTDIDIDQAWTDLTKITGTQPSRNQLVAMMLNRMLAALNQFATAGLAAFTDQWQALDVLAGKPIILHTAAGDVTGVAAGINQRGELQVKVNGKLQSFNSGEVSVRISS